MTNQIYATVSGGCWSYLTDGEHYMAVTLENYGSCTPADVLNKWLTTLSSKDHANLVKRVKQSDEKFK